MILPTKHISQQRALLTIGSDILIRLNRKKTESPVWEELLQENSKEEENLKAGISYDWIVLALSLLFTIGAIDIKDGLLRRSRSL